MKTKIPTSGKNWLTRPDSPYITVYANIKGKRVKRVTTLLNSDPKATREAEKNAKQILLGILAKEKLEAEEKAKPQIPTLLEFAEHYITVGNAGAPTKQQYRAMVRDSFVPHFQKHLITDLQAYEIDLWFKKIEEERGAAYAFRSWQLLRSIYLKVKRSEMIERNPFAGAEERKKPRPKETKPFTRQELNLLLEHAEGWVFVWLVLLFGTGRRPGELMALTVKDVDFERGVIKINKHIYKGKLKPATKNGEIQEVDMLPFVSETLSRYLTTIKNSDGWLFTTKPGHTFYAPRDISDPYVVPLMKKLGIDHVGRPNRGARTTFGTLLAMAGGEGSLKWLQRALGHSQFSTTYDIYAKSQRATSERLTQANNLIFSKSVPGSVPGTQKSGS